MNTIQEIPGGVSFPIAVSWNYWLEMGIAFTGMPLAACVLLLTSRYDNVPPGAWLILGPIFLGFVCVFGFFLCNGLGMLLYCVGRIELDRETIAVKLGRITIRKWDTDSIKTVAYTEQGFGKSHTFYYGMLVLSTESPEEIERKGNKKIDRELMLWRELMDRGMRLGRPETAAYAYCQGKLTWLMLGCRKGLAFGYTDDRKEALRRYLRRAEFLA